MLVKDKITVERQKRGMSTAELGAIVGVNKGTISRYESGSVKQIPTDALRKIVEAFECDFDSFVMDDPKYCMLADDRDTSLKDSISEDEYQLIAWYRALPAEVQNLMKQACKIHIRI